MKDLVKSIVKPDPFHHLRCPVYVPELIPGNREVFLDRREARINHYVNRSIEYVKNVKFKNKEHMDNRKLTDQEKEKMLRLGNDEEDVERLIDRFIPELKRRLQQK